VLAAAGGTPFVALEYRPKVRDFAVSVDMEAFVLRTDRLDALEERVVSAIDSRSSLVERMQPSIDLYRQRLRTAAGTLEEIMS